MYFTILAKDIISNINNTIYKKKDYRLLNINKQ